MVLSAGQVGLLLGWVIKACEDILEWLMDDDSVLPHVTDKLREAIESLEETHRCLPDEE